MGFCPKKIFELDLGQSIAIRSWNFPVFCTIYLLSRNFVSGTSKNLKVRCGVHMFVFDTIGEMTLIGTHARIKIILDLLQVRISTPFPP